MNGSIGPAEAAAIASHLTVSIKLDYLAYAQGSHGHSLPHAVPGPHTKITKRYPWGARDGTGPHHRPGGG
jgi:hypothetical protein